MSLQGSILKNLYNGSTWKVPGASMISYFCLQITRLDFYGARLFEIKATVGGFFISMDFQLLFK
jgi:hypothetical protein